MRFSSVPLLAILLAGCVPPVRGPGPIQRPVSTLLPARPAAAGFSARLTQRLDSLGRAAVADGTAPAVAIAVGRYGRLVHLAGYGRIDAPADAPAVTPRTVFDLASVTKVVATTTAAMILEEDSLLDLDRTVAS